MMDNIRLIVDLILSAEKIVIFTGAGVSTESGIPDFRSAGGIWSKYDPEDFTYQRFLASEPAREKYWQMSTEFHLSLKDVQPNAAHKAIVDLEKLGKLDCLITQNIDGLHQLAGTSPEKVIELHGTARSVSCLECKKGYTREAVQAMISQGIKVPRCDQCQGLLKPDTISFGQSMPMAETDESYNRSARCDLFIVIGSSLVVQPAASMPLVAKDNGAKLVILNRDPTPYDHMADAAVHDSAGSTMAQILEGVQKRVAEGG